LHTLCGQVGEEERGMRGRGVRKGVVKSMRMHIQHTCTYALVHTNAYKHVHGCAHTHSLTRTHTAGRDGAGTAGRVVWSRGVDYERERERERETEIIDNQQVSEGQ